jgi:hypothetical protein
MGSISALDRSVHHLAPGVADEFRHAVQGRDQLRTLKMTWKTKQGRLVCRWVDFDNGDERGAPTLGSTKESTASGQRGSRFGTFRTVTAIQRT